MLVQKEGQIDFREKINYNIFMKNRNLFITLIILGIWVFVSPWVLGFSGLELALWSNIFSGTIAIVSTLWIWLNENEEEK